MTVDDQLLCLYLAGVIATLIKSIDIVKRHAQISLASVLLIVSVWPVSWPVGVFLSRRNLKRKLSQMEKILLVRSTVEEIEEEVARLRALGYSVYGASASPVWMESAEKFGLVIMLEKKPGAMKTP